MLKTSENEETFLIYLFKWEPGLSELNSNFLPKWDNLVCTSDPSCQIGLRESLVLWTNNCFGHLHKISHCHSADKADTCQARVHPKTIPGHMLTLSDKGFQGQKDLSFNLRPKFKLNSIAYMVVHTIDTRVRIRTGSCII